MPIPTPASRADAVLTSYPGDTKERERSFRLFEECSSSALPFTETDVSKIFYEQPVAIFTKAPASQLLDPEFRQARNLVSGLTLTTCCRKVSAPMSLLSKPSGLRHLLTNYYALISRRSCLGLTITHNIHKVLPCLWAGTLQSYEMKSATTSKDRNGFGMILQHGEGYGLPI